MPPRVTYGATVGEAFNRLWLTPWYHDEPFGLVLEGFPQSVEIGVAAEDDAALSMSVVPGAVTVPLGLATEEDSALVVAAVPGTLVVAVGVATEEDIGLSVAAIQAQIIAVGIAVESDSALAIAAIVAQTVPIGVAVETNSAFPAQVWTVPDLARTVVVGYDHRVAGVPASVGAVVPLDRRVASIPEDSRLVVLAFEPRVAFAREVPE